MKTTPGWVCQGEEAPRFTLPDQRDEQISLSNYRGKWVVLYFYPKDGSFGCTRQACEFRDQYQDFQKAGADVIGISSDDVHSHRQFARSLDLPYRILSDAGETTRRLYGVPKFMGKIPGRVTFVIDPEGIVRYRFSSQFSFKKHTNVARQVVDEIGGAKIERAAWQTLS